MGRELGDCFKCYRNVRWGFDQWSVFHGGQVNTGWLCNQLGYFVQFFLPICSPRKEGDISHTICDQYQSQWGGTKTTSGIWQTWCKGETEEEKSQNLFFVKKQWKWLLHLTFESFLQTILFDLAINHTLS